MSAFSPILYDNNKPVVNICKNEELIHQIVVYKKVKFDGTPNKENKEYYDEKGNKVETPQMGAEVFLKLGKRNSDTEAANVIDNIIEVPPKKYYIHKNDEALYVGGRKPKRLSHLSKKRNMKSRRVRKSRRRYSRRKY